MNIGLQFWSIRDAAEGDLLETIEKVSKMGYKGAQFAGFGDHKAEAVKEKMDEIGIYPAGAHVPLEQLENNLEEILSFHEIIKNGLIIVPYLEEERRQSKENYEEVAQILGDIGQKAREKGFTLAYHNHDFEFDQFDGKTGFDIIFENTNPEHLKIELDCFWADYAGYDPLEIIEENAGRVVSLHIKDRKNNNGKPLSTELGAGTLPLLDYVQKGQAHQVEWFVVEQEHFTKDPLESAMENAETLKNIFENRS